MPAFQTTYDTDRPAGLPGMIADTTPQTILSRVVEAAAGMAFGIVATQGTGDRQVRPAAANRAFVGIVVMDPVVAHQTQPAGSADFYPDKDICNVLVHGAVWVVASVAVAAGDPAYFVPATGVITNVATANTAINGRFETSAGIGALTKLRLI